MSARAESARLAASASLWLTLLCLAPLWLAGCAAGPNFSTPAPPKIDRYAPPDPTKTTTPRPEPRLGGAPDARWWAVYRSRDLDELIARGVADSPTLQAAREALTQSREHARAGAAPLYPALDLPVSVINQRYAPVQTGQRYGPNAAVTAYTANGSEYYLIDLFGAGRRRREALKAQTEADRHAVGAAYLLLTGSIAQTAMARAGYVEETRTREEIVSLQQARIALLTARWRAGRADGAPFADAAQELADDRADLAAARQRAAAAESLLKTLLALAPADPPPPLPTLDDFALPADVPVSLPSELVRRRPDILQSQAALHQATAEVGVAVAAEFPSVTLSAAYGGAASLPSQVALASSHFWAFGPTLDVPLLQGGARLHDRRAAEAGLRAAGFRYRETVLVALQQVADALSSLDADAAAVQSALQTESAARTREALVAAQETAGLASGLERIDARALLARARLKLIAARAQQLQDVVALQLASGGGWSAARQDIP